MLSREAVAATLALAGVRSGAQVLDLAPDAGLTRAARAAAGASGRVDGALPAPGVGYGHLLAVRPTACAEEVIAQVEQVRPCLVPAARVVLGSRGPLSPLADTLRAGGWAVLHASVVPAADAPEPGQPDLALVVVRAPLEVQHPGATAAGAEPAPRVRALN
jgi:predicted methyltransferase